MRVKLDENMPEAAAEFFRTAGSDVETVYSEKLSGSADPIIVAAATTERRVLITLDKGIANISTAEYAGHAGVILLRLKHPSVAAILSLLQLHVSALEGAVAPGKIVVLSTAECGSANAC